MGVLDLLAPTRCLVCRVPAAPPWCGACRSAAPIAAPGCPVCADPWRGHRCPFEGSPIVATEAVWAHRGSIREVIVGAKARNAWAGWSRLALDLARLVEQARWPVDAVVGVPASRSVVRRRGVDHAVALAASTAKALGRPHVLALTADARRRDQVTGSGRRGEATVADAFGVRRSVAGHVLLVDDVLTTGRTASHAAAALTRAGAGSVRVAVLARAGADQRGRKASLAAAAGVADRPTEDFPS